MSRRLSYLALGDSYTIGEGVEALERFPAQLTRQLRARGLDVSDPVIIARTGWTTDELMSVVNPAGAITAGGAIPAGAAQGGFALVTLLIGVNNQYRGRSPETYRPEFVELLERAIALAENRAGRVIVVSIPDWGVTPFGHGRENVGQEIDAFNAVNRAETARLGARYVDITPMSRQARDDTSLVAEDGLHPSGKMYARWVELILPVAQGILRVERND